MMKFKSESEGFNPTEATITNHVAKAGKDTASQWKLIAWKFKKHRLAVISLYVIVLIYVIAIFADFLAPYAPLRMSKDFHFLPPSRIHFFNADGDFHGKPFVYGVDQKMDMNSLQVSYVEDRTAMYDINFFVRGYQYKLFGFIPLDIHLFGVDENRSMIALFGTDELGGDRFSRVLVGSQVSLTIGLVGISISFFLGILFGGISGYFGGIADLLIQRLIEFIRSIPTIPLWMAMSAAIPANVTITQRYFLIVVILSLIGWTGLARVVRGKFLALREEDFITAARLDGAGGLRIIFIYLLPSFWSHIIANISLSIPGMILGETALSFLDLGMRDPAISWGILLKEAQSIAAIATGWPLIPALAVIIVVLAFSFIGDGLRDAADPYQINP